MIAPINQFPLEILLHIFSYVPPLAVPKIERVCRAWNAIAKDKEISSLKASMLLQRPILINKIPEGQRRLYIETAQKIKLKRLLNKGMVQTGFPNLISDRQQMLYVFARQGKLHLMASHPYMVEKRTNHQLQNIICIQKLQSVVECFVRSRNYPPHLESFHLTRQLHYILFAKWDHEWPIPSREIVQLFQESVDVVPKEIREFLHLEREKAREERKSQAPAQLPGNEGVLPVLVLIKKLESQQELKDRLITQFPQLLITDQMVRNLRGEFHSLHLLENEDHFFLIKKVEGVILDILIPFDRGNAPGSCLFTGEPTDFVDGIIPRVDVGRFRIEARKEAGEIKIRSFAH